MDFAISAKAGDLVARIRHFIDHEVIPCEALSSATPDGLPSDVLHTLRAKAKAARLWAPQLPAELGGLGLALTECVPVFEAAGRSLWGPAIMNCAAPDEGNMHLLHLYASDEQRERYLKPLAAGELRSAFALTEPAPGAGSDPTMLQTLAVREGDSWVINGHKWWTSGADGAAFMLVMARTDPSVSAHKGSSIFIVPMDTAGVEIVRRIPHMGGHSVGGHCEIRLRDVRLPESAILGGLGEGFAQTQARLGPARLTHCMRWMGIAQRALEIATEYASQRSAFGKTLVEHEGAAWMLADSATELHAGRLMVSHAAWLLEQGEPARQETSMAKVFVAEAVHRTLDRAIQICGGLGISRDLPLSEWYEAARAFRIYDGASEVHRMVIAREVVRRYGKR
jgi:acyl-CoA dehydrogenase